MSEPTLEVPIEATPRALFFSRLWKSFRQTKEQPLIIFDDFFPHPLSSFRFAEFTGLLDAFPAASVHTSCAALPLMGYNWTAEELIRSHVEVCPQDRNRLHPFHPDTSFEGAALYCVFFQNMSAILERANRDKTPFVFTLYPGGRFLLRDSNMVEQLKPIFESPNFRSVIVTQPITREYLLSKRLCDKDQIHLIYGAVLPPPEPSKLPPKQLYGVHKDSVDICFVAFRYTERGQDKGYDTFVAAAALLLQRFQFLQFHIVGPWDRNEVDVSALGEHVHFHGSMSSADLKIFFRRMDLILSPNSPFTLLGRKFDGFPTGCCVEAGLSGVAVCASDELKQNGPFTHGEDILITSTDPTEIAELVGDAISDYDRLTELASRGQARFSEVYGWNAQMRPRLGILSRSLSIRQPASVPAPRPVPPLPQKHA